MIKFLFDNFKNAPLIGDPIKVAYVGYLVNKVIKDGKKSSSAKDLSNVTGDELEDAIDGQANDLFDEFITPEISEFNIPEILINKAKKKAIEKLAKKIREESQKKVEAKIGITQQEQKVE